MRVDGVTCRTSDVGHDIALLPDEGIDEGGLTRIGASHDGDTWSIKWLISKGAFAGKSLDDSVQEIPRTTTTDSRDGHRVTEAEGVELGSLVVLSVVVRLVSDE